MKFLFKIIICVLPIISLGQQSEEKEKIDEVLSLWHEAAASADFDAYFSKMTNDGVFIGTDATENWQNEAFKKFSKPYFDKGKAWSFYALERNIYLSPNNDIAWFDELLNTQMKICRGSGVMQKVKGEWKIAHYVLSIAVPNEFVTDLVKLKATQDSILIKTLSDNRE
jgi:ketosteroid isomerase-like protein